MIDEWEAAGAVSCGAERLRVRGVPPGRRSEASARLSERVKPARQHQESTEKTDASHIFRFLLRSSAGGDSGVIQTPPELLPSLEKHKTIVPGAALTGRPASPPAAGSMSEQRPWT